MYVILTDSYTHLTIPLFCIKRRINVIETMNKKNWCVWYLKIPTLASYSFWIIHKIRLGIMLMCFFCFFCSDTSACWTWTWRNATYALREWDITFLMQLTSIICQLSEYIRIPNVTIILWTFFLILSHSISYISSILYCYSFVERFRNIIVNNQTTINEIPSVLLIFLSFFSICWRCSLAARLYCAS